jgi:hypothetical protein
MNLIYFCEEEGLECKISRNLHGISKKSLVNVELGPIRDEK